MKRIALLAIAAALVGCTSPEQQAAKAEAAANEELLVAARARLTDQLRDPNSAEYSEVAVYRGTDGQKRVCGYVNAANAYGGRTGRLPFIAGADEAFLGEGDNEASVLLAWPSACVTRLPD